MTAAETPDQPDGDRTRFRELLAALEGDDQEPAEVLAEPATGRPRRRWRIRGRGRHPGVLDVEVAGSAVYLSLPRGPVKLRAADVELVRQALTDARAAALWLTGW